MIRRIEPTDYPRLLEIWESAVRSTHDFLREEDFRYYKEQVPTYFPQVTLVGFEQDARLTGFIGTADGNIEMLFVENASRGQGIGRQLVRHAIEVTGRGNPIRSCTCSWARKSRTFPRSLFVPPAPFFSLFGLSRSAFPPSHSDLMRKTA